MVAKQSFQIKMLSPDNDLDSGKKEIVKEGYLDVKYPPGSPERRRWKVWHHRWVTALNKKLKHGNMVYLQISDFSPGQQSAKSPTILWETEITNLAKLFRSHSGSRLQKTFGITQPTKEDKCPKVLIYLAGNDEEQTELWMEALRNAILPPAPLSRKDVEEPRYSVSLIDDTSSFNQGLLGTYGYLEIMQDSICVVHPHSGYIVAQWPLSSLQEGKLQRSDHSSSSSGVFTLNFRKTTKARENQIYFYSSEARSVIVELNEMIKLSNKHHNVFRINSNSKIEKCAQKEISILGKNNTLVDKHKLQQASSLELTSDKMQKNSSPPICISKIPSKMHSNMLNSSISSTCQISSNLDNSSDESDYSPPISPLRTDFCNEFDCTGSVAEGKPNTLNMQNQLTDAKQLQINGMQSQNFHSESHFSVEARKLSTLSIDSHVYADIMTSRTWRQFSVGNETLYEELLDSPNDRQINKDQSLPPLPPPRCPAKRPTDLRLEQLSESVENTLVNLEKISPSRSTPEKKTAIYTMLGNPLKGVKKILSKDKKDKSEQSNSIKEVSKESKHKTKQENFDHSASNYNDVSLENYFHYEALQNYTPAADLPVPFLSENSGKTPSILKSIAKSVMCMPTTRKYSWSVDSLQPEDFKRKHTCLRHLLEHLENKSNNFDDVSNYCSCPSSNQTNTPLASPQTLSRFSRRQSKSLSADIEKHFRNLQGHQKSAKIGLTLLNDFNDKNQDPMYDYCPMEFTPASPTKAMICKKEASVCTNHSTTEDSQNGYIDMDMRNKGIKE